MPFREKSAWINLLSLLVALVFFVASLRSMMMFLAALAAYVILQVALHFISSRLSPTDARIPLDEREQTIRLKAARNAYWALIVGVAAVPFSLHFGGDGGRFRVHTMTYIAVVAVILAEMVRAISQIVYFRRGR